MQQGKDKSKQIDPNFVKSYLDGKGSREEQLKIDEWFADLWANEELRKVTHERWDNIPADIKVPGYDQERIQDRIHHIIRLEEVAEHDRDRAKIKLIRLITRVAAILFIPLALYTLFNWKGTFKGEHVTASAEIHSPRGARTSFLLPDGSTGWLNGGSTLSFPTKFTNKNRTIQLNGEAYFDVLKNPEKPFVVVTDELNVKVFGTSFNIMAYPEEKTVEVTLETGEIEVFGEDGFGREKSIGIMTPGKRGVLMKGTSFYKMDTVDVYQYTSWKEGKLVFRNEPMTQVIRRLNRWYNVNIIIRDSRLETYTYRATFMDEKLDEVLKIFQRTSPIVFNEIGREKHPDGTYGKRTIEMYYHTHN